MYTLALTMLRLVNSELVSFRSHCLTVLDLLAGSRVLVRISKIPVQNSNFKISAHPDIATNLLQILIPCSYN